MGTEGFADATPALLLEGDDEGTDRASAHQRRGRSEDRWIAARGRSGGGLRVLWYGAAACEAVLLCCLQTEGVA